MRYKMEGKIFYYFGNFWEVMIYVSNGNKWICRRREDGLLQFFEDEVLKPIMRRNKFWEG